jgi:DNA-binding NtrC family response regulator
LNIIKIELPPLRERREDIPMLTEHFIQKFRKELNTIQGLSIDEETRNLFQRYHWPGNVRELSNTLLRLMVGDDSVKVKFEILNNMKLDGLPVPWVSGSSSQDAAPRDGMMMGMGKQKTLKDVKAEATKYIERKAIVQALNMTGWNKRAAAKMLKISYKALFYKMADLEIQKGLKSSPRGSGMTRERV